MTNKYIPIHLVSLQVNFYGEDDPLAKNFPGQLLFDNRSDFAINSTQSTLAVLLAFSNVRLLHQSASAGIRRPVSVSLTDTMDSRLVCSANRTVCMNRTDRDCMIRIDLPFNLIYMNLNHAYTITVHDTKTKQLLGKRDIRLFDESDYGESVLECFTPLRGGLLQCEGGDFYKSLHVQTPGYFRVGFILRALYEKVSWDLPEMEIRVHFPNGAEENSFGSLRIADPDEGELEICDSFFVDHYRCGTGFAELRCLNVVVAAFAFSTDADEEKEAWKYGELMFFRDLSPETAIEQFGGQKPLSEEDDSNGTNPSDSIKAEQQDRVTASYDLMLSGMTGLKSVKTKLATFANVVKFNKMRLDNNLSSPMLPLHAMFLGSPGTGKTTVAKQMGRMLWEAGLLSKGHVVEKQRANLLGPNYSNEETNTLEAIEEAQGGILFIDEAYQLYQPQDPRDPGRFVIETLMTALADESRRDWMLILAGYPAEMERMFDMNPGLKSRIPDSNIYVFEDFSSSELMEIAENYLLSHHYMLSPDAREALAKRLAADCLHRDKKFGNARYVINLILTEILPAMAKRVVGQTEVNKVMLTRILACDIPMPKVESVKQCQKIGFHL